MRRVREIVRTAVIATNAVQCAERIALCVTAYRDEQSEEWGAEDKGWDVQCAVRRALCVTAYRDDQSEEWCAEDKGWDKQCAERTARHKVPPQT